MLLDIGILLGGLIVLITGGEYLVRGASNIALRLHISPLIIGLTIVAFGTSAPELFISIKAALEDSPDMAMGNVIGSNICNLALVLGITAVFSPIPVNSNSIKIDWPVTMGSSLLLYILVIGGYLKRVEGIIFVILLISYVIFLIRKSKNDSLAAKAASTVNSSDNIEKTTFVNWAKDIFFIAFGIVGLTFGSDWFVLGAKEVFLDIGIEERIIGIIVLALGTSLPELVTSIVAALKRNTDLAVGNLMGSNIFNVLSILGITSIIKDIRVSSLIVDHDMLWMLGITLAILPMMAFKRKIERWQGVLLLGIYFFYIFKILP